MKDKITKKNGFTMAELLIVVAIIAVLVAVAIPIFNKQLEKSREAYDIATMRQAASAAIDIYNSGVYNKASAQAAGMGWWGADGASNANAFGAYDPKTSTFKDDKSKVKSYGKGTTEDAGTTFVMGNDRGAYGSECDYRNACVMVSIYPNAAKPYAIVYWKNNSGGNQSYVGGEHNHQASNPEYCIRINID